MKGPGLPGFRKQVGRGFYKSPGFDINTSNRSPMKQGEEDGYKQAQQDAIDKERKEYLKYIEEGGDPNKINWEEKVVKVNQDVKNRTTTTTTEESQFGIIPKEIPTSIVRPGDPGYDAWVKAVEGGAGKQFEDRKVFRGEVNVEEKTTNPDIEWTNIGLGRDMIGHGTGTVKHDNNDGTFRYRIRKDNGEEFGELSASDIDAYVKSGKMKHEVKNGKATGRLLMSKDYHENTYQPLVQMQEDREANYNDWVDQSAEFRSNASKQAVATALEAGKKGSKAYNQAFKEYRNQVKSENPKMYPKRGIPEWMHGDPNFPADYNQPKLGIYNDDEMVNNYTNYTKSEEGKWTMKEGASGISHDAYNSMTEEEQNEIQRNLSLNSKKGKGATGRDGIQKAPTPDYLANESDYATGSEEGMRINERETE